MFEVDPENYCVTVFMFISLFMLITIFMFSLYYICVIGVALYVSCLTYLCNRCCLYFWMDFNLGLARLARFDF